jgi:fructose-1,6-bisphosphatase/inositol monophosphatase family enzyme
VYQPLLREYFCAVQGEWAKLNGRDIQVAGRTEIGNSMIVLAIPSAKDESFATLMNNVLAIAPECYSFRYCGSVALDLAYVACGRIDGVVWGSGPWWDVAAASLLVDQAGGLVSDGNGNPIGIGYDSLVASGTALHAELLKFR